MSTAPRPFPLPKPLLPGTAQHPRGGNSPIPWELPHRSLTISFLELFIRTWSCSLVTMMPSVSSASFTMNLQREGKSLTTQYPDPHLPSPLRK